VPAVPDLDLARIAHYCENKVPKHLRDQVRVEMQTRGRSVTILECRPPWHPNLTEWSRVPVAQLRYDTESLLWTLYCADRNSRWHLYIDTDPGTVDELLTEINADPTGIFWG
jgi:Protein of unknown function (DUF3024)